LRVLITFFKSIGSFLTITDDTSIRFPPNLEALNENFIPPTSGNLPSSFGYCETFLKLFDF
jgi:hypothetical protein